MTPKEKAKELVDKFYKLNSDTDTCFGDCNSENVNVCDHTGHGCGLWKIHAKQCALIGVDEILKALNTLDVDFQMNQLMQMQNEVDYWQQVLEEIEKL